MAGSDTPPFRSYLRAAKSGPSAVGLDNESSSDDEAAAPVSVTKTGSQPRSIPRSVSIQSNIYLCVLLQEMENIQMVLLSFLIFEMAWQFFQGAYGTFLATSLNLPLQSKALGQAYIGYTGRRLLHV